MDISQFFLSLIPTTNLRFLQAEAATQASASASAGYSEELLKEFISMGFKRELIITYLKNYKNNKEQVLAALLASSLSFPSN